LPNRCARKIPGNTHLRHACAAIRRNRAEQPESPPIPFEKGNALGERHGFYPTVLPPVENDEIGELADAIRELSPLDAEALEPQPRPRFSRNTLKNVPRDDEGPLIG
jgi:hypothetical protein